MHRFENKVVVITGGSSGIGLAAAKAFAAEGAHVYITGRRQHELDLAAASIGRNASAVRADASVTADLEQLYQTVGERHGRVDVVFANAGYVEKGALANCPNSNTRASSTATSRACCSPCNWRCR